MELMVVIALIAILLVMGTLGVRGMQAMSRDNERQVDVDTIATNLESTYSKEIRDSSNAIVKPQGSYLPVSGSYNTSLVISSEMIAELEKNAIKAPGQTSTSLISLAKNVCNTATSNATTCNLVTASVNNALTASAITPNIYIYVPLVREGDPRLCTTALVQTGTASCRSFKIYYVLEKSPTVVRTIGSKRQ